MAIKLKRGDTIEVISGTDKGKRGEVLRVLPEANKVVVQGINIRKKHQRQQQTAGRKPLGSGIVQFEGPMHVSNVMLVCPTCGELTRVARQWDEDLEKNVRMCRNCDSVIP